MKHTYSDHITNKRILLCGPYPPPLGGVSIHIKRVKQKLESQQNIVFIFDATQYPTRIKRWFNLIKNIITHRPEQVHYHTLYHGFVEWFIVVSFQVFLRYKLYVIDHDCRDFYTRHKLFIWFLQKTLHRVDYLILIGDTTKQSYKDHQLPIAHALCESPYLPPEISEAPAILATYPPELFFFLQKHSPILVINASRLILINNQDLYGIDTGVTLLHMLKKTKLNCGLVIALAQRENHNYFDHLQQLIAHHNLYNSVFFLEGQRELWPLFKYCDLFLRPTLSDSYGISIAEALHCNVPALASNVCIRPCGTLLYNVNDINDLYEKALHVLTTQSNQQRDNMHPQPPC